MYKLSWNTYCHFSWSPNSNTHAYLRFKSHLFKLFKSVKQYAKYIHKTKLLHYEFLHRRAHATNLDSKSIFINNTKTTKYCFDILSSINYFIYFCNYFTYYKMYISCFVIVTYHF